MNSLWNKNLSLFKTRFPALASLLSEEIELTQKEIFSIKENQDLLQNPAGINFFSLTIKKSRSGEPTALYNNIALHSTYAPLSEAERTAQTCQNASEDTFIFFAFGLGYLPVSIARKNPGKKFILIEPDPLRLFTAFCFTDFQPLFNANDLFIITKASSSDAVSLIESTGSISNTKIFSQKAQMMHAEQYFSALFQILQRIKEKEKINTATLERFSSLWLKNSCRNLEHFKTLSGTKIYFGKAGGKMPAVIIAAGPTLEAALPYLNEIKKRAIVIAVDTALRATLRAGCQPDFVILTDPQYYAARHIAGLCSPESVLITESAAYPSVFRFDCRKIVLCSSLFPLGQYFEARLEKKGELGSGGSVATTAWDFAMKLSPSAVYCIGLDLGYPENKTHIKGSTFEEASHSSSSRIRTAEKAVCDILLSAKNENALSYDKSRILTDSRMKLFAWWFESKIQQAKDSAKKDSGKDESCTIETYTLSSKSLFIPGIKISCIKEFLMLPEITDLKKEFFASAEFSGAQSSAAESSEKAFSAVLESLISDLKSLASLSQKGISLCNEILIEDPRAKNNFSELEKIDSLILSSSSKQTASLVFPTQRQLEQIFSQYEFSDKSELSNAMHSKIIYQELLKAVSKYLSELENKNFVK